MHVQQHLLRARVAHGVATQHRCVQARGERGGELVAQQAGVQGVQHVPGRKARALKRLAHLPRPLALIADVLESAPGKLRHGKQGLVQAGLHREHENAQGARARRKKLVLGPRHVHALREGGLDGAPNGVSERGGGLLAVLARVDDEGRRDLVFLLAVHAPVRGRHAWQPSGRDRGATGGFGQACRELLGVREEHLAEAALHLVQRLATAQRRAAILDLLDVQEEVFGTREHFAAAAALAVPRLAGDELIERLNERLRF
mmetsp:Transcript_7493/g.30439  ORF Transcript_7493/g.30439 Transcript_7493/m.30439 type:complete len:259 (+) Transcript_7493:472-1248(+)